MSTLSYSSPAAAPISALMLISQLVSGKNRPGKMWQKPAYRFKFLCRSLVHPRATLKVMKALAANPLRNEILLAQPTLPCKVHRTYLAANMPRAQHVSGLCDHYRFVGERMPHSMHLGHLGKETYKLASFIGKDEATYSISMNSSLHLDKEGEITLRFLGFDDEPLAMVTFALINFQGVATLFIGAIQGPSQNVDHSRIQQATKACHGLFPKRILMEAVLLFAEKMNMQQVFAVGNETHIYTNRRYSKRKKSFFADYNAFWETLGAQQHDNGYFSFPLQVKHRSLEDVPSKKRAEYRRRYQLLDEMETQIRNLFG